MGISPRRSLLAKTITLTHLFFIFFSSPSMANNPIYHKGPLLTSEITVHIIWYGNWHTAQKEIIREFINSISGSQHRSPSVSGWWKTVQLYTDKTGSNVTGTVRLGKETDDMLSHGKNLTRLSIQSVIIEHIQTKTKPSPVDPKGGIYLVLTAADIQVESFCNRKCGFHYFLSPSFEGYKLPYVWVGNSVQQCPNLCAYPFAGSKQLKSPNGDIGIDGMVNEIGSQMLNVVTNPLFNGWYDGHSGVRFELDTMCTYIYATGGDGYNMGKVFHGKNGAVFNMYGIRRRFLVQWMWNYLGGFCTGPNAVP